MTGERVFLPKVPAYKIATPKSLSCSFLYEAPQAFIGTAAPPMNLFFVWKNYAEVSFLPPLLSPPRKLAAVCSFARRCLPPLQICVSKVSVVSPLARRPAWNGREKILSLSSCMFNSYCAKKGGWRGCRVVLYLARPTPSVFSVPETKKIHTGDHGEH